MKKVRLFLIASVLVIAGANVLAQPSKWTVDPAYSSLKFTVSHLNVSEVEGRFKGFIGTLESPSKDFNNAKAEIRVASASITTDDATRDKSLKSDDFFDIGKYPEISFKSTSFKKVKDNIYALEGNLTIRDVTKKVKFTALYGGTALDPNGKTIAGFKASGRISRKDYGLKWNKMNAAGSAVAGDEVNILLNLEFTKQ
jgi:polyisoprenoid-binding protein YceI